MGPSWSDTRRVFLEMEETENQRISRLDREAFIPRHVLLKSIELLEKCRCEECKKRKREIEAKL